MFQVGQKVKTRDGRSVRILCVDLHSIYPVVAAVMTNDIEIINFYNHDGKIKDVETKMDLIV